VHQANGPRLSPVAHRRSTRVRLSTEQTDGSKKRGLERERDRDRESERECLGLGKMTRGKQKIEAQRRNAEKNQKPKGSQLEARQVGLKVTCPICKVRFLRFIPMFLLRISICCCEIWNPQFQFLWAFCYVIPTPITDPWFDLLLLLWFDALLFFWAISKWLCFSRIASDYLGQFYWWKK